MLTSRYFLTTSRLGFRTWSEGDFDLALGLWGDPRVTELIDARGRLSPDQVRERLRQEIATEREHGVQYWPIFALGSGEHVGCCGLRPYREREDMLELGFHIRSALWGQGYAAEAARAVIQYAFEVLQVAGLFAGHHPRNEASRHLLGVLGFRYTHDGPYAPTGLNHPSYFLPAGHPSVRCRPGL
jgi:ribosomal-protein-alanine N-acetyltransferase